MLLVRNPLDILAVAHTLQEVAKQSNLAIAVVHRPHLNAAVVEVLVRVREDVLGPTRRAFLACGELLTAWARLEVIATTWAHPTLDHRPHVLPPGQAGATCVVHLQT